MKHVISHNMIIAKSTHVKQKIETISYHVIRYIIFKLTYVRQKTKQCYIAY